MKISFNWLKDFLPLEEDAQKVAEVLTDIGLEVEKVEEQCSIPGGLAGLVIGEVLEKTKHPNADKLSLTKVTIGGDAPLSIVCGAPNVEVGQRVVVAPVGCTIYPMKGDPFEIRKAKIRGEVSEGMICAEDEIGLGKGHDGIMVLDQNAPIGSAAADYFKIESETVFDIGLTPNRGDATSHLGVARDLAVYYDKKLVKSLPENFEGSDIKCPIRVDLEDDTSCLVYMGLLVNQVEVTDSPDWLKNKLNAIGVASINNVVDITNFVLHHLGQPIHAFDASKIEGEVIKVGLAKKGDKFTTLDGKERELSGEELMIKDAQKNLAIAGVFGGLESGITEGTSSVFIESACFSPSAVRKSAKLHGLNTDASFRYERGTDPGICDYAIKLVAILLCKYANAKVASNIVAEANEYDQSHTIELETSRLEKVLGVSVPDEQLFQILKGLEIATQKINETKIKCEVPAYRWDVTREIDLIEEVLRFYGYNKVPIPSRVSLSFSSGGSSAVQEKMDRVSATLRGLGFHEIMNNSLTSSEFHDESVETIKLSNPLSKELDIMRPSLIPQLYQSMAYNHKRKNENLKLFEWGKVYEKRGGKYIEKQQLIIGMSGNQYQESWEYKSKQVTVFDIKSVVKQCLEPLGLEPYSTIDSKKVQFFSSSAEDAKRFGLSAPVFGAVLEGTLLNQTKKELKIQAVSKFPSVRRDLSLVIKKTTQFEEVKKLVRKVNSPLIKELNVFDVYEGKPLKEDEKSYSVSFFLQHDEKTLTDEEIDAVMNRIIQLCETELNALIRR